MCISHLRDMDSVRGFVCSVAGMGNLDVFFHLSWYHFRRFVQETYEIEDCSIFDDCTSNSIENIFNVPSNVKSSSTYSFSTTGWKYGNVSSYTGMEMNNVSLTFPFEISLKLNDFNKNGFLFFIGANNEIYLATDSSSRLYFHDTTDHFLTYNQGHTYKLKCYSDKTEVYDEDTLIHTTTKPYTASRMHLDTGSSRWVEIKDFKIKPL